MKTTVSLFFMAFFMLATAVINAQLSPADSILTGDINSNATLSASKRYLIRGFVNVKPPATLTIEPGTILYGEKESKATLIINRGAKINAQGTKEKPIVFTSQQAPGQRNQGDWGGIIIAGYAPINVPGGTSEIEGGTGTIFGGGANPDPNDNSGIMTYCRLEFSGIEFLPNNEINGLTLGGVGKGTKIEYFQVSYCGDDSFEWFGGTVDHKYLISVCALDDDFDTDLGYTGRLQFGLIVRDPDYADISSSNGFETDGDPTGSDNSPFTKHIASNVTSIGPMPDTSFTDFDPNYRRGAHIRRNSRTSIYNSIIMGWPVGLLLDGEKTVNSAISGELQIRNTIWAGLRAGRGITTNQASFDADGWYMTPEFGNRKYVQPAEVMLTDPFNVNNPNPVPMPGSPAATGASFTNPILQDAFFTPTTYIGAFDPNGPRWDEGWTNYDPQFADYVTGTQIIDPVAPAEFRLVQNYPNPFNPSTFITYALPQSGNVSLKIYDALGKEVTTLVNSFKNAGVYEAKFDATDLTSGVYFYQLVTENFIDTKKMILMK